MASADPMILPPMQRTLVSECDRARAAQNGSWRTARRTHASNLVSDHGTSVADTIDENAPLGASFAHGHRSRIDVICKVHGSLTIGSEVLDGMALPFKQTLDFVFEREARVIACQCNFHRFPPSAEGKRSFRSLATFYRTSDATSIPLQSYWERTNLRENAHFACARDSSLVNRVL